VQQFYSEKEMAVLLSSLASRLQAYPEVEEEVLQALESLLTSLISQLSTFGTAVTY
jgi:hypothetical protein